MREIALFFSLIACLFLIPFSARAEPQLFSSSDSIIAFALGVSFPVVMFLLWRFFTNKPKQTEDYIISKDELFNYTHDLTTNLPTAQHALKQFEQVLKTKPRNRMAAIVFKPINFRQVNTVLGHHNSDILLLQLAYCLQKKVTDNQSLLSFDHNPEPVRLARSQGLDFLVVFDLSTSKHEAKHVIDDLCQQLTNAVPDAMSFKSFSLNFELAFGVAISDEHGNSVSETVSHATDALLNAESKEQTIQYFDQSAVLYTEQQLALMERLRQDIIAEDLRWYLQPQVNVGNNALAGFELKVHWYCDDKEPLGLLDFIDLAEHSGEVYCLTKQMFKQAFEALFTLHGMGVYQRVSVSLSSKNLLEPDLVDFIEQQMQNFNIAGKYLMIELNEQVMLSACQRAKNTIDQLKSLDVAIAIANFSGSYESLRYLRKMAIHQVKINCQQLGELDSHSADRAIINALITLTRSMQIPLVGTHIDKHETANQYIAMGGQLVQGDIINRGVVPEEIEIWLKRWFTQHPEAKPTP
ncbi:GGDEF domain-containing protein [Colwellia psychrerythraea]|uniref:GGDEF domain-containing protein n=1 Tax=Colwellia psychrerythraea TaxID=28229 RepID=A0A1Y5E2C4_COLPS|nr:GGDEF domain-containing protein [Colwellia sp. 39_35_sub15_T18]OUR76931.1 GGDEF domain-containing protein [Colwellia psychrerythraea]